MGCCISKQNLQENPGILLQNNIRGKVIDILDGRTIIFYMSNKLMSNKLMILKIYLKYIKTPNLNNCSIEERNIGKQAKYKLEKLILNKKVILSDITILNKKIVSGVIHLSGFNNISINEVLIESRYAVFSIDTCTDSWLSYYLGR